jgi:predicted methyltransferase
MRREQGTRKRRRVTEASKPRQTGSSDILDAVALEARLAEGPEGVRRLLRIVFRAPRPISIGDLARSSQLPVPVVAAVRGELEKRRLLARKGGIVLTDMGLALAVGDLGFSSERQFSSPKYPELGEEFSVLIRRMGLFCQDRPVADVKLDQSHATVETALRRAIYLFEQDGIEGRDLIILGDDDLTSLAVCLVSEHLDIQPRSLVVMEFDTRLVEYLEEVSDGDSCLTIRQHDLRENLPQDLKGGFDVFLTDPPYTHEGLNLFVSRGVEALRPQVGKQGFICFGNRTPSEMAGAMGALVEMGLAPVEIIPNFNHYVGAQVLAGVSQMIRTMSTPDLRPNLTGHYTGPLYTADRKRHASSSTL